GAYRSAALMEVYAVHQQVIMKTDDFYGYGAGALSLCAAAVCPNESFLYFTISDCQFFYLSMSERSSYGKVVMRPPRTSRRALSVNHGPLGLQHTIKSFPPCQNGCGVRSTRPRYRLLGRLRSTRLLMIVKWKIPKTSCSYRLSQRMKLCSVR
ncbi:hypothetical protein BYT27DRAFT_7076259, partial [Phlegmacium glaucopus]